MIPDPAKLPFLLRLIDDDSEEVQNAVLIELAAYGGNLESEISRLYERGRIAAGPQEPFEIVRERVQNVMRNLPRIKLKRDWENWFEIKDDKKKLEAAYELLCAYQSSSCETGRLKVLLDALAAEYLKAHPKGDPKSLAEFLFKQKQLKGADQDYYNPQNSNLLYVLENKKGIPISLASIYILIGARLGLPIEGCNYPGHFLARVVLGEDMVLIDCFNGGQILDELEIDDGEPVENLEEIIETPADAETIIARVLNNLAVAYRQVEDGRSSQLMSDLLMALEKKRGGQ